jgi:CubicO group peptidase (beta-lactamase class C family)
MTTSSQLIRSTPEHEGVDSRSIGAFLDTVEQRGLELHSFMLCKGSRVVAEGWKSPYRASRRHMLHSLTKSVASMGVGIAIEQGYFDLDTRVISFFPNDLPARVSPNLEMMTVRHLLTMTTGHATGISGGEWRTIRTSWVREFFKEPVVEPPGSRFIYSSASSYMLSAIVQKMTGRTLRDYLDELVFRHLDIDNFEWDASPEGITSGGNGLSLTTEAIAKIGILHLQRGDWRGRQVLPKAWVEAATSPHLKDIWMGAFDGRRMQAGGEESARAGGERHRGYGYQWWMGPDDAYYAYGIFGQYCVVLPRDHAVIAFTAAIPAPESRLLELVWSDLAPALAARQPRPDGPNAASLTKRIANLALAPPPYRTWSLQREISGGTYLFEPNADDAISCSLTFTEEACLFVLIDARGSHEIKVGLGFWIEDQTTMTGNKLHHEYQPPHLEVAASGTWLSADVFQMTWIYTETAFRDSVRCTFAGNHISFDRCVNVNTSGTVRPTIHGSLRTGNASREAVDKDK